MFTRQVLAALAAVSAVAANFDALDNSNMAVYWGQGPAQPRLAHFCEDTSIDIIPIAFLNVFPDQANGGYPGTNFGNQCGSETYKNKDGSSSPLLSNCPSIGPDIKTCQVLGKKILLSLGGAIPTDQSVKDDASAVSFAKFLWQAFGPEDAAYDGPRPFADAVVDGFDFDIESAITDNDPTSQYRGYGTMIDTLRVYFAADAKKQYYISGSPQCVTPDAHLAHPIQTSWFDFLFIQFYNTPQCSARAYFDATYGAKDNQPTDISFDAWVNFIRTMAMNKEVKLYIGLPAAPLTQLAYDTKMYIAPDDVINLIDLYQCRYPQEFGGIMVFEATYSEQNLIDGKPYVDVIKSQLTHCDCAKKPITSTVTSSTSSSSSSSSSIASSTSSSSSLTSSSSSSSTTTKASASASMPTYASSTAGWNSTTSKVPVGTGSSSIPAYSSTGVWNLTRSTSLVGTGSSSIPPYPTSTGIWNSTYSPGPTGTGYSSSSMPSNSTSSVATSSSSSVSSSSSLYPTGASSGLSSLTSASSVPYPISNSTSMPTTTASGGVIYTTATITLTQCPPEVISCPVRTSVTTYPFTTSSSVPVTSVPTNSPETTISVHSPSVIYTTETIILTRCPLEVTSCPVRTSVTTYPVTLSISLPVTSVPTNSLETTTSASGSTVTPPVTSHGVYTTSAPGMTTTVIVTSYVTTCPVTSTAIIHGSTSVITTSTVSTVHTTIVSTIPVVPVQTTIPSVVIPVHPGSSSPVSPPPSSGNGNSPLNGESHPVPQQPEQPSHGGPSSTPSTGNNGNSPIGNGANNSPSQPQQPAHGSPSGSSSGNGNSPVGQSSGNNTPQGPQAPAAPGLTTTLQTSTKAITNTATLQNAPTTGSSAPAAITQTLVPIPVSPEQTAHPAGSGSGASAGSGPSAGPGGNSPVQAASPLPSPSSVGVGSGSAPLFPAGNGTASGAAAPSGSGAPSASAPGTPGTTVTPFTGAAGKLGGGSVVSVVAFVAAAALLL